MQQPPWMPFAWSELGQRECPGSAVNPRILAYFRRVGHASIADDATAWCAAFAGACLEAAGLRSTHSLTARSYLDWGLAADEPAFGAITVLARGSDPASGHVGFLVGLTGTHVILLGGNQSNAVSVAAFDRARVLAFRLPAPADVLPRASADNGFDAALVHVLAFEGGWSDDPFDPGGPTNKGITLAVYARERGEEVTGENFERLKSELRAIPDDLLRRIYLERYWHPAFCPDMPAPLALFHFDASVNQGVAGAARMLQEALGVPVDGEIGPVTLAATHARPLAGTLAAYADIRSRHYRSLHHFWRFGRGWLRRVDATLERADTLATAATQDQTASATPQPQENASMSSNGDHPVAPTASTPAESKWWGGSLTIWGALLTALTTVGPTVFAAFGWNVTPELVQQLGQDSILVVQALGGLIGTIMTIAGRVRATTLISRRPLKLRV